MSLPTPSRRRPHSPASAIQAYGANNQLLGTGTTGDDGVAEIAYTRKEFAGFRPAMLIAKSADDFNYLPFNTTRINTSRFEVGGRRSNPPVSTPLFTRNGISIGPGEQVNFSVILRDRQWKSPGELPDRPQIPPAEWKGAKVIPEDPQCPGLRSKAASISPPPPSPAVIPWKSILSNDVLLATQPFRIEEFVPDRIKVTAQLDKTVLEAGDAAKLNIHAVNFFGPPAANRNYECEIQVHSAQFQAEEL